jgi:aspartyl-tRNA(Asn)/glutamyl-tRNA(Gln) amidotransferase subunit C
MSNQITKQQVAHIALLTSMTPSPQELTQLTTAFAETLQVINQLQELNVDGVEPTHHVTGLKNVVREDRVRPDYSFTQKEALANADNTHRGFFVVPRVLERD